MRATTECGTGVQASAKIDHFGKQGRVRGNLDMIVSQPARIRMDVFSFGVSVATLTSDGKAFALADLRDKRFYVGRASACNRASNGSASTSPTWRRPRRRSRTTG